MNVSLVRIPARRSHSNHEAVARQIGLAIVTGQYPEGSRLPGDAELLPALGVSRPVLREALKTLAAKGLIVARARVGTVVRERAAWAMFDPDILAWHLDAGIDARFLHDLADIRRAVEPEAAALAAARRTVEDLAALRTSVEAMAASPAASPAFADGDLALHLGVARASGNPFMASMGAVIEAALRASFRLSAPDEGQGRSDTVAAHARIVDAIEARDGPGAASAMMDVIESGLRRHAARF
ncbi:FadR family transcriptional regulator [Acetobacteraceae bacterium H6797]|nr:FadR family transcriptional regulator [Acetobacteraceae bacterium H6797]